jgi:hypothetical protein
MWGFLQNLVFRALPVGGGLGALAYVTGFDKVIYRTLQNFLADAFVYLIARSIEWFVKMLDLFPDVDASQYQAAAERVFYVLGTANTFFPILLFVYLMGYAFMLYVFLIGLRIVLKFIPGMGG